MRRTTRQDLWAGALLLAVRRVNPGTIMRRLLAAPARDDAPGDIARRFEDRVMHDVIPPHFDLGRAIVQRRP